MSFSRIETLAIPVLRLQRRSRRHDYTGFACIAITNCQTFVAHETGVMI
jgi:hypothetical protein